jgi:hypothetical protein
MWNRGFDPDILAFTFLNFILVAAVLGWLKSF